MDGRATPAGHQDPGARYSLESSVRKRSRAGSYIQFSSSPAKSSAAKMVARTKPYLGCWNTSLTHPMASGPSAAAVQVKNRITPETAPCSVLGKQLMPFEFSVG